MSEERLAGALRRICGDANVLTHPHQRRTYESDALLHLRATPALVCLPGTAAEVADVLSALHDAGVPWVARGAGTGLSGGALPVERGVLVVLSRMRRILDVDVANARVVCEPGVSNLAVSRAVAPTHFFPPDPSSQIVCTVGGNVAENSGGAHCFKYGFTTNYVTGLQVVLPDGDVVDLGGKELDRPGYDLVGAFVGSEGTLGVAIAVTLRVVPVPEHVLTLVTYFDTVEAAGQTVSDIVASGAVPAALEIMDRLSLRAAEEATAAGNPTDVGAALIVELDGPAVECEARLEAALALCERNGAHGTRVARDEAERAAVWRARKAAFAAMGRISPSYYVQDSVVPRTRLAEVLRRIEVLAGEYGFPVANVFHAGDGNLHPLVAYDPEREGDAERAEELAGRIVLACVEAGGSITGEHGVGVDKKGYMPSMFGEADLAAFQKLRCAFDPAQRANPGKVMPTPRLCGEVPGPYRRHPLEAAGVAERL
ncbi:MAG: FAD-binding protein [Thermoleophilia bacterium]|nr:FAD-binding protein [Thermoleophilia bacterium]